MLGVGQRYIPYRGTGQSVFRPPLAVEMPVECFFDRRELKWTEACWDAPEL